MNVTLYSFLSTLVSLLVLGNAYTMKEQFYPTVAYLAKSNIAMMIIYNQMLVFVLLFAKVMRKIFFGPIRDIENEHIYEKSWYTCTEAFLIMTIFREEFNMKFLAFFVALLFSKTFHWLMEERVNYMQQNQSVSFKFHVRIVAVTILLSVVDAAFIYYAVDYSLKKGKSMQLLFACENILLGILLLSLFIKYIFHAIDMRSENPWENKSMYLFYVELFSDFVKLIVYLGFFGVIVKFYGFPLHIIRDLYMTFRSFVKRSRDFVRYRRAIANLNERYPDATPDELAVANDPCVVCREEMISAKKLPCGHFFHLHCLRRWFERQQTCPTCRQSILDANGQVVQVPAAVAAPQQPAAAAAVTSPQTAANATPVANAATPQHRPQPFVFQTPVRIAQAVAPTSSSSSATPVPSSNIQNVNNMYNAGTTASSSNLQQGVSSPTTAMVPPVLPLAAMTPPNFYMQQFTPMSPYMMPAHVPQPVFGAASPLNPTGFSPQMYPNPWLHFNNPYANYAATFQANAMAMAQANAAMMAATANTATVGSPFPVNNANPRSDATLDSMPTLQLLSLEEQTRENVLKRLKQLQVLERQTMDLISNLADSDSLVKQLQSNSGSIAANSTVSNGGSISNPVEGSTRDSTISTSTKGKNKAEGLDLLADHDSHAASISSATSSYSNENDTKSALSTEDKSIMSNKSKLPSQTTEPSSPLTPDEIRAKRLQALSSGSSTAVAPENDSLSASVVKESSLSEEK